MAERNEWPSEQKIADLRREGELYLSLTTIRMIGLAAVSLFIIVWGKGFFSELTQYFSKLTTTDIRVVEEFGSRIMAQILLGVVGVAMLCFVVGVLQTKLFFRLNTISPQPNRLWLHKARHSQGVGYKVAVILLSLPLLGLASIFLIRVFWPELFKLLPTGIHGLAPSLAVLAELFFGVLASFAIVFAFISWLAARYRFMLRHRMTRAEIENEARQR